MLGPEYEYLFIILRLRHLNAKNLSKFKEKSSKIFKKVTNVLNLNTILKGKKMVR